MKGHFTHKVFNRIRHINAGYFAAFLLLILCYALTIIISSRLKKQTQSITNRNETIISLEQVLSRLKSAQSAWGEYIITNNKNNFTQYYTIHRSIDSVLNDLYRYSAMSTGQRKSLDTLNTLINHVLPPKRANTLFYTQNNAQLIDSLRTTNAKYGTLVDSVTEIVKGIQVQEKNKVENQESTLMRLVGSIKIISYITLLIAIFLFLYIVISFTRERIAKRKARQQALDYHEQLEFRIKELTKMNKEITRLKSMEKFTTLGRVAALLAHEIKNPLTNINLATTQLSDKLKENKEPIFIDIINRNSNKINTLINNFLNATSLTELHYKNVSINKFIDETLFEAQDRISLEDIQIKKDYAADICEISIDSDKMKIAFQNIIFNAIEAMEPGEGILKIKTEGKEDKCVITISDNGSGMDEETLSHIFEPYYTTKSHNGTGLGLAQAQNIIFNHKGNIEVESELGKGSFFIIYLNFAED